MVTQNLSAIFIIVDKQLPTVEPEIYLFHYGVICTMDCWVVFFLRSRHCHIGNNVAVMEKSLVAMVMAAAAGLVGGRRPVYACTNFVFYWLHSY